MTHPRPKSEINERCGESWDQVMAELASRRADWKADERRLKKRAREALSPVAAGNKDNEVVR